MQLRENHKAKAHLLALNYFGVSRSDAYRSHLQKLVDLKKTE